MPNEGYCSITVKESAYNRFYDVYKKKTKSELTAMGVDSFAGYITHNIEQLLLQQIIRFRFKLLFLDDSYITIKDTTTNKLALLRFKDGGIWCDTCNKEYCIHYGFCVSLHQIYPILAKQKVVA